MYTNASDTDLDRAMFGLNKMYDGNVVFREFERETKTKIRFTITMTNSKCIGHHKSGGKRNMRSACWHVHGHFFEELFAVNPDCWVRSGSMNNGVYKGKITKDGGNWEDYNVGSIAYPMKASQCCDCGNNALVDWVRKRIREEVKK